MILVDSSIWVDFFTKEGSAGHQALSNILLQGVEIGIVPPILSEVLMGFRRDSEFRSAKKVMSQVPTLALSIEGYVRAAILYRVLKRRGITVRGAIVCIIAQSCLDFEAELLTRDRDFNFIAKAFPLKMIRV